VSEAHERPRPLLFSGWKDDPRKPGPPMVTLTEDVWEMVRHINAPRQHRRLVGRAGSKIPMSEAVRLGLVEPQAEQAAIETQDIKNIETQDVRPPRRGRRR
jgi:hypothetical protein